MSIFIDNKYTRWYYEIINNAKSKILINKEYIEKHHIIPKSIGGSNNFENLVKLTAKEHYICHLLLTKMVYDENRKKMIYALWRMSNIKNNKRYVPNSAMYEKIRKEFSKEISTSFKGIKKNYSSFGGKKHKEETKKLFSKLKKGENNPMWGKKQSKETIHLITIKQKGISKPIIICEHCNKEIGGQSNYIRWHGNNCKLNTNYDRKT